MTNTPQPQPANERDAHKLNASDGLSKEAMAAANRINYTYTREWFEGIPAERRERYREDFEGSEKARLELAILIDKHIAEAVREATREATREMREALQCLDDNIIQFQDGRPLYELRLTHAEVDLIRKALTTAPESQAVEDGK
jgi:hypothetical protein